MAHGSRSNIIRNLSSIEENKKNTILSISYSIIGVKMEKKILVVLPVTENHKTILEKSIVTKSDQYEFVYTDGKEPTDLELKSAHIIIGSISPNKISLAENLEWLQLSYAGTDAYTADGVLPKNVVLTSSVGAYGLTVSEHMIAQTFALIRNLSFYAKAQREHKWEHFPSVISIEGATIAVLGMGNIGGDYARKMKALGAYIIGLRKSNKDKPSYCDEQYTLDALHDILPRADIVAMVLPGTKETYHIINEQNIFLMKKGAFLLNAGRGNAIEENALIKALTTGHLAGAAIDVMEKEPLLQTSPLWDCPHLIITPHVAGQLYLKETLNRIIKIASENLSKWCLNEELINKA